MLWLKHLLKIECFPLREIPLIQPFLFQRTQKKRIGHSVAVTALFTCQNLSLPCECSFRMATRHIHTLSLLLYTCRSLFSAGGSERRSVLQHACTITSVLFMFPPSFGTVTAGHGLHRAAAYRLAASRCASASNAARTCTHKPKMLTEATA